MRVEMLSRLQPVVQDADRLVVYDTYGNPILLAVGLSNNAVIAAKVGDPEFPELLRTLGISKTVVVTQYAAPRLPDY